jgi:putative GTP pyrophosphokinase
MELSKTQIDRLGERLKTGTFSESDLEALDAYRVSHGEAYQKVIVTLREKLHLSPTGRPAKSTSSVVEKLRRETIRLTQVQDIAGCRLVVSNVKAQERLLPLIRKAFDKPMVFDRRIKPSHGYRAIHIVVKVSGKLVEIQLRTKLQHLWAELSEKLSDRDPKIKYGGGDVEFRTLLEGYSKLVSSMEQREIEVSGFKSSSNDKEKKQISNMKKMVAKSLSRALILVRKEKAQ